MKACTGSMFEDLGFCWGIERTWGRLDVQMIEMICKELGRITDLEYFCIFYEGSVLFESEDWYRSSWNLMEKVCVL